MTDKRKREQKPADRKQLELLFQETWRGCGNLHLSARSQEKENYLQALCELAGAVAHELFQPLTAMVLNAELLLKQMDPDAPGRHYAEMILKDIDRLIDLIGNIDRISAYKTKPYLGETKILDLDKSTPSKT